MNALRTHADDLNALVTRASAHLGVPAAYVEKDFWVTEVLRSASAPRTASRRDGSSSTVSFIFKGGTSLSRVYGIIERFSEDVDLLAAFDSDTATNARHKVLKQVHNDVMRHLDLPPGATLVGNSTTGVKRYTTYRYPAAPSSADLREGVVLELGCRGGDHPTRKCSYQSMIAQYAIAELEESVTAWDEFEPFVVQVLAPERTLLEKLAAVHDASARNDTAALSRHGRHFYDIERLLSTPTVQDSLRNLGQAGVQDLTDDINRHSEAAGLPWTPRPEGGYGNSPAFNPEHTSRAAIGSGYEAAQALIHGERFPFDRVLSTVEDNRDLL